MTEDIGRMKFKEIQSPVRDVGKSLPSDLQNKAKCRVQAGI